VDPVDASLGVVALTDRRGSGELRHNATTYDACHLALAELLGARLVTGDATLAAVPGTRCEVELVEA
jgi:predicted nucleic acid-binding protein